jgi:uroporphyrin-3 C-methyltransferase
MLQQTLTQNQQTLLQQQQIMAAQEQALVEQREQLAREREQLRQQGAQVNRSLSMLQKRLGGEVSQWQVAEAEYLIRVAHHRLVLMADVDTALAALKSADERLQDTGDPDWNGVREVLAQDMAHLRQVPRVDRDGLSAQLSALIDQVDQLSLADEGTAMEPASKNAAASIDETKTETGGVLKIQQIFQDFWRGFKSLMVVRHHDQPITAMLPPEQRYFLVQNLVLKLEGAKLALLGRNASLYQQTLETSIAWLERHFAPASTQVIAFREQLLALAVVEIAPELPDISASLRALDSRRVKMNRETSE